MAHEIPLTGGGVVLVDDGDLSIATSHKWFANEAGRKKAKIYAMRSNGRGETTYLHRVIAGAERGQIVDHINGDTLDNRRCNLRIVTASQNCINRFSLKPHGFRGVEKRGNRFRAIIQYERQVSRSRLFDTAEAAAREYDRLAREIHGDFAMLNFPEDR